MNTKLLIDAIMRQTTVLIANLSTAPGVRAPLAHVADQVFLDLSRAIEGQGIGRKVVADMFGMTLRSYQKRVNRLIDGEGEAQTLLWDVVLAFVTENAPVPRAAVLAQFHSDGTPQVAAVLNDLVEGGLLTRTGRASSCVYGVANPEELQALLAQERSDTLTWLVQVALTRSRGLSADELQSAIACDPNELAAALLTLRADGKIREQDGEIYADALRVPVGAESGWEAAVYDHYQAVCTAIGQKVSCGATRSHEKDRVGGATLGFDLGRDHPFEDRVAGLLSDVRTQINELWNEVQAYNADHPRAENERESVVFYFGQYAVSDSLRLPTYSGGFPG